VNGVLSLIVFVPLLAVTVRGLQDTHRSVWRLLSWFVPFIGRLVHVVLLVQDDRQRAVESAAS